MRLRIIYESKHGGKYVFALKDGRRAEAVIEKYDYEDKYEILVYVDGERVGVFTLGIYGDVAQMDSNVKGRFRRLGIATGVYNIADRIAAGLGVSIKPANDISDLGAAFWASRY